MQLTEKQARLVKELLDLVKSNNLYPNGLREPDWVKIERYKEIKRLLGI